MYLLCFVLVKSVGWGIHADFYNTSSPIFVPNFNPSFPALTGMLALALFIHNIIVTVMRNNKHQEKNVGSSYYSTRINQNINYFLDNFLFIFFQGRDLSIAFTLVILTYLTIGVVFYLSFPLNKHCIEAVSNASISSNENQSNKKL